MMGAVDNVDYCDARLEASHGDGCEGPFSVVGNVSGSPPSSVEEEDDADRSKVGRDVGQSCCPLILLDLRWGEGGKVYFRAWIWCEGFDICLVDMAYGWRMRYPFSWWWRKSWPNLVVGRRCLELLNVQALGDFWLGLIDGAVS